MAAGDPGSPARYYSSTAVETSLQSSIPAQSQGQTNTSFIVASISGFPVSYPYTLIVDPDTSKEEVVTVTAGSTTTLTVIRGEDNTQAVAHSAGAVVRHGVSGRDFTEEQTHISARGYDLDQAILDIANQTHVHGIATGEGVVVGTDKTQTLNNKTIGSGGLHFEGSTDDGFETTLTVVDPTADRTITFPNVTGTVTINDAAQTLSNKTLGSALAADTYKITGLGDPTNAQDAATKNYVDTGVSSGVVAAAASAAAAASSASNAASSASAAATSATNSANSATSASGSATSATNSATNAATSATNASNSASAASTSATNASNSATAAATSATNASNSATAAASSATNSANSATAAAASATSAEAAYDSFDDRYLGAKSSPPSTDNDGNPLTAGVIYYNTTDGNMYVWNGGTSSWQVFTSTGDITAVTAGTGLTGGGTAGAVTLNLDTTSVYVVPSQATHSGKYLTTDGSTSSWAAVDALPSQTGNGGKYLTTDGSTASWQQIVTDPTPSVFMLMGA